MLWTVKKSLYRAQQRVMKLGAQILPFPVPTLLMGPGSTDQLAENVAMLGLHHVLLVTDKVLVGLGLPDPLVAQLAERGVRCTVFDAVQPNPTIENVEAGRKVFKDHGCDAIIGFGGGSAMDCAKIIGARIGNPMLSVRRMKGLFKVILPIPPLFCVPTTAGTGSEATIVGVISDPATHEKFAINDFKLLPRMAVLDPVLMSGMPPALTAATGMDALTHAVESYIGLNGLPFSDNNAEIATQLVLENLETAYEDGSNLEARRNMGLASYRAGLAFTRAYVGYVHAIAHNMGGLYGVPHGLANAVILPHVLRFCRHAAEKKLATLAIIGSLGTRADSDEELSHRFIARVEALNAKMGIPTTIAELQEKDIPLITKRALAEAHPDYPVPLIMTRDECDTLVRQLLPSN
ncbi:MAG: alcohol dehydrogenase [Myxococcota bacterium]|jgi:alcohol dehydrogenase